MKIKRKNLKRTILTTLLIIGVFLAIWSFIRDNSERINRQNEEYISELTIQRAISIDNLISENLTFIRSTAYLYGESLTSPWADVAVIRNYEENSAFELLRFIDTSGDNYTSRGVQANLSDREYFKAGMRGESGVTYVDKSRVTGQRQIGFYAPVYYDGEIIGVMVGFYGEEYVNKLLSYELFGYEGEGWLLTREGVVLGSTIGADVESFFAYLSEEGRCQLDELTRVESAFLNGKDVSFKALEAGESAVMYAVPLNEIDWVLVRSFPAYASRQILNNANGEGVQLLSELILLFAVYGVLLGLDVIMEQRRTREANRNANDVSMGVSKLFEKFVTVDMETLEYRYIVGLPEESNTPMQGAYGDFCALLLKRIADPAQREETRATIEAESLKALLSDTDSISLRVHAPTGQAEWFTYNFIVIERMDGIPKRLLIVRQDVTSLRKKEEEEQKRLQEALDLAETASKAKSEFLFNMSHDLRTPMNAIIGYTELAQGENVGVEEMRDYIRKIDASSGHLLALINDILEMSRIESGKITLEEDNTNLMTLMREAEELFAAQMGKKRIDFSVSADALPAPWVVVDHGKLNRILLNLIGNAYKFTNEGGRIEVRLTETMKNANEVEAVFTVADNGIGMRADFVDKLFLPFERERTSTVSKIQGTGLGLSITKQYVDLMGGTIDVDTEQGRGTTFTVRFSLPVGQGETVEEAPRDDAPFDTQNIKLLLVEDNEINREIASMILTQFGFQLDTAENGQIAVDKLASSKPGDYDAVLMDIQMPVMDGYTAARAIRALPDPYLRDIPIVAMTANAFQEDREDAMRAGMNGHIAKPLDVDKMLETLKTVLQRRNKT